MKRILISLQGLVLASLAFSKPLFRTYPTPNCMDTIIFESFCENLEGDLSSEGDLFTDSEILHVHLVHSGNIDSPNINENGKYVVQQQGKEACPTGVADMFSGDKGKYPKIHFGGRSLSHDDVVQIMDANGLPLEVSTISYDKQRNISGLFHLKKLLTKHGSLIIGIADRYIGSHFIIIDEISNNFQTVRLRDPWHGWDITVTADAVRKRITDPRVLHLPDELDKENIKEDDIIPTTSVWNDIFYIFKKNRSKDLEEMFWNLDHSG
ncbi:MAG: hypothetical protein AB8G05_27055 [Oligoflexales bacterium]